MGPNLERPYRPLGGVYVGREQTDNDSDMLKRLIWKSCVVFFNKIEFKVQKSSEDYVLVRNIQ